MSLQRLLDAAHEGLDRRLVLGRKAEDLSAGRDFLGMCGRQPVQVLVQVYAGMTLLLSQIIHGTVTSACCADGTGLFRGLYARRLWRLFI
jgi:anthranilate/para-aminobenzoate synthase component II